MPRQIEKYRILVSSPQDCRQERDIVKKTCAGLNNGAASANNIVLEAVLWETHSAPGIGRPQDVIFEHIGEFDLLVGIFWQRFGTPSGKYNSGTEEEIEFAYQKNQAEGKPEIMLYFNQAGPLPSREEDFRQYEQVMKFRSEKEKQQSMLCWTYNGAEEFQELIRKHLESYILKTIRGRKEEPVQQAPLPPPAHKMAQGGAQLENIRFWDGLDFSFPLRSPYHSKRIQNFPTGITEFSCRENMAYLISRLAELRNDQGYWNLDKLDDEFNNIYATTSVLYFFLQFGFPPNDPFLSPAIGYLDKFTEFSADTRAKWFFDIMTERISEAKLISFCKVLEGHQAADPDDPVFYGSFLFYQGSEKTQQNQQRHWQMIHPGGRVFHVCYVSDILLHIPVLFSAARKAALPILAKARAFLETMLAMHSGYFVDRDGKRSPSFSIWAYSLLRPLGATLPADWQQKVERLLSQDLFKKESTLELSFLLMAIMRLTHSQRPSMSPDFFDFISRYVMDLIKFLESEAHSPALNSRDLAAIGRAILYGLKVLDPEAWQVFAHPQLSVALMSRKGEG